MVKGSIQQENTLFVNIYTPKIETPKYRKQILTKLKGEIDSSKIIVGTLTFSTFTHR